jgi:hypothetical protein
MTDPQPSREPFQAPQADRGDMQSTRHQLGGQTYRFYKDILSTGGARVSINPYTAVGIYIQPGQ